MLLLWAEPSGRTAQHQASYGSSSATGTVFVRTVVANHCPLGASTLSLHEELLEVTALADLFSLASNCPKHEANGGDAQEVEFRDPPWSRRTLTAHDASVR
jgi:hypothetical protein